MPVSLIDASSFSSYWKLVRTAAWILRYLKNVRWTEKSVGELTATELRLHYVLGKGSSGGSFHRRTSIATEELSSAKTVQNSTR
jgi:hypothetical protein